MPGLEDLARGFQRFRRTPAKIHETYLAPMHEALFGPGGINDAKILAEASEQEPEHYRYHPESRAQGYAAHIDAAALNKWLVELRGAAVSGWNGQVLSQLSELDDDMLVRLCKLPQSEYVKKRYGLLASQVEGELEAIAATLPNDEQGLVPLLFFLAHAKTMRTGEFLLTPRGMPISLTDTADLEAKLNDAASGRGYFVRRATGASDLLRMPEVIGKLGIKTDGVNPKQTFLISQNGVQKGFLIAINEAGPNSPLYTFPFIEEDAAAALGLSRELAKYLGYDAVKMHFLLDKAAIQAAEDAGIYLLETKGFTADALSGVFVDILSADEATRRAYGTTAKSRIELAIEGFQQSSEMEKMEKIVAATWTHLTATEFLRSRLPKSKIRYITLEVPEGDGEAAYFFSFDGNRTFTHDLIYVLRNGEVLRDEAKAKVIAAAAVRVAKFFNGSTAEPAELGHMEFWAKDGGGVGIFYCSHKKDLPVGIARVNARFSPCDVVRYIGEVAGAAGHRRVHVDISYCNLDNAELARSRLPTAKNRVVKEVVATNLKPDVLLGDNLPEIITGASVRALTGLGMPFLLQYSLNNGMPQLAVVPSGDALQPGQNTLEDAIRQISDGLFHHYYMENVLPRTSTYYSKPIINEGSAVIRLTALPTPKMLKETLDTLFPASYLVKELRWVNVIRNKAAANAAQATSSTASSA